MTQLWSSISKLDISQRERGGCCFEGLQWMIKPCITNRRSCDAPYNWRWLSIKHLITFYYWNWERTTALSFMSHSQRFTYSDSSHHIVKFPLFIASSPLCASIASERHSHLPSAGLPVLCPGWSTTSPPPEQSPSTVVTWSGGPRHHHPSDAVNNPGSPFGPLW